MCQRAEIGVYETLIVEGLNLRRLLKIINVLSVIVLYYQYYNRLNEILFKL